jgi:hypothetical protein
MAKFPINNTNNENITKKLKSLSISQSIKSASPYTTGQGILNKPEYMPPVRRRRRSIIFTKRKKTNTKKI